MGDGGKGGGGGCMIREETAIKTGTSEERLTNIMDNKLWIRD